MFATVEGKDAQGGVKTFIRDLFSFPEIEIKRINLYDGGYFYRVIATEYRGQIPTEEVCEQLKKLKGSVIFDLNFPCDKTTRCLEFHPGRLPALLLFNSFCDYIAALHFPAAKSSLTVFDTEAAYADEIYRAVSLFGRIEVYTKRRSIYEKIAAELMDEYGVTVPVRDSFNGKAVSSTVILSPDDVPFCDFFPGIIFTLSENAPPCNCLIRGEGIDLPKEYELLRPGGIDKMAFACALYEKANVKSIGNLSCKKLKIT